MMTFENIIDLATRLKTPYIRISDMHGNRLISIEGTNNVSATIKELNAIEPMLKAYGKLEVVAATVEIFKANYKGAYKWLLSFESEKPQNAIIAGINQWNAPAGYISNDVMIAKLETMQKQFEWEKEKAELKKKDSFKEYMPLIPVLLTAMGYPVGNMDKLNTAIGSMGYAKTHQKENDITLSFKDVEKMSEDQKNERIEILMGSLASKISAEHMILLLEALDKRPELAEKAVNFLPML